MTSHMTETAKE